MASPNETSWRKSQENESDDSDDSFRIPTSDDEELASFANLGHDRSTTADKKMCDSSVTERLTPMIRKAIRRSIHQFSTESSDEPGDEETEDENDPVEQRSIIPETDDDYDEDQEIESTHLRTAESDESSTSPMPHSRKKRQFLVDSDSDEEVAATNSEVVQSDQSSTAKVESAESSRETSPVHQTPMKKENSEIHSEDSTDESETSESSAIEVNTSDEEYTLPLLNASRKKIGDRPNDTRDGHSKPKSKVQPTIDLDSSDDKENQPKNSPEENYAMSMARGEMKNKNVDPIIGQKKAYLIFQRDKIKKELEKTRVLCNSGNLQMLPDNGARLLERRKINEQELERTEKELMKINSQGADIMQPKLEEIEKPMFKQGSLEIDPTYLKPTTDDRQLDLGKKAQVTFDREQSLTVERLKDLHGSIISRPADNEQAQDPRGLKVPLMPHQKHALAWLLWRETQRPRGGVLADDMGLGKTLTMISLIMASIAKKNAGETSDDEDEWINGARSQRHLGGTLVVAPASLVAQWEGEVKNRCKRNLLAVELYHGPNREKNVKRLAKNDIVITTYNIISRSMKEKGVLFRIHWKRVILDEAHVIRNHKSITCMSVCEIEAEKRWALTGTPIQNKEMDLFAVLKFLRCSPFDDVRVWKRWVDNKNMAGHERLATVMKSIMLRRTKAELQAKGDLESLPDKSIEIINVDLDHDERLVYDKVMMYSRTIFAQFLSQRAEKAHGFELGAGKFDQPSWKSTGKITQFNKAQQKLLSTHADVSAHQILVLLLRLRQTCCHASLIDAMLDQKDIEQAGFDNSADHDHLLTRLNDISLLDNEPNDEVGVDERVGENLLTPNNPVFDKNRRSSKMRAVLEKVKEITAAGDKVIIVSQWTSVLNILARELNAVDEVTYKMFTGNVLVKDRQGIMDDFNNPRSNTNVLLLSLTAGGVGLNLVGANHMLLIDIHWNPQLECQAQDRIYRFGQSKNVYIYKYLCTDTIEERIKALQDKKLEIAASVLGGGGKVISSKLTLDDMKSLFGL